MMAVEIAGFSRPGFDGKRTQLNAVERDRWDSYSSADSNLAFVASGHVFSSNGEIGVTARDAANMASYGLATLSPSEDIEGRLLGALEDSHRRIGAITDNLTARFVKYGEPGGGSVASLGLAYVHGGKAYFAAAGDPWLGIYKRADDKLERIALPAARFLGGPTKRIAPGSLQVDVESGDVAVLASSGAGIVLEDDPENVNGLASALRTYAPLRLKKQEVEGLLIKLHPPEDYTVVLMEYTAI
jgi:hypothetical protein